VFLAHTKQKVPDKELLIVFILVRAIMFPKGNNMIDVHKIGNAVRIARKEQGITQEQLAALSSVGRRFIIELEGGKESCHLGKVLHVLLTLGIDVQLKSRHDYGAGFSDGSGDGSGSGCGAGNGDGSGKG
jgi:y4mF family transcriptional regulator